MLDLTHYVGPLGGLRALPDVAASVDTTLTVIGGIHTSLTGNFTRDRFGFKRAWTWTYPHLTMRQAQYVEALQLGLVPGPLYLIDPRRINRLPVHLASGGSLLSTPDGFIPTNSAVCYWRPLTHITAADTATLPAAALLRGAIEMQTLTAGPAGIELGGHALDGRLNIPVLGAEPLDVSAWLTGRSGLTATVSVAQHAASGQLLATTTSDPIALSLTEWRQARVAVDTAPATAYLRVRADQGSAAPGSTYLTALQVARSDAPDLVAGLNSLCGEPEPDDGWWLGGGAAQVVADVGASAYTAPGLSSAALTLTERF